MFNKIANWIARSREQPHSQKDLLEHLPANPLDGQVTLPRIIVRCELDPDEFAVVRIPATWYRRSNSNRSWRSGGSSIRLGGGIRLYSGGGTSEPRLAPRLMSEGELIGTLKRLLFVGTARSVSLPFDRMLDLTFGLDFMDVPMKDADTEIFAISGRIIGDSRFRDTIVRLRRNDEIVASVRTNELASVERRLEKLQTIVDTDGRPKEEYLRAFDEGNTLAAQLRELYADKGTVDTETLLFRTGCTSRILALHSANLITSEEADYYWVEIGGQPYGVFSAESREKACNDPKIRRKVQIDSAIVSKGLLGAVLEHAEELPDGRGGHLKRLVLSAIAVGGGKAVDFANSIHWLAAEAAAWDAVNDLGGAWQEGRSVATTIREFFQAAGGELERSFNEAVARERRIFDQFCSSVDAIHAARKTIAEQHLGAAPTY